jgi:GNAT superfamily N-acetyltransferase
MLDKSLPYIGIIMVRQPAPLMPAPAMPPSFNLVRYTPGMEQGWADIETSAGEFEHREDALAYFQKEFMPWPEDMAERCLFILDNEGKPVATTSAWYGNLFGITRQPRLHWVAVRQENQRQGLSTCLIHAALTRYQEIGETEPVYLTSQTWSYIAIRMYLRYGFTPYTGPCPSSWKPTGQSFAEDNERAWSLIMEKIERLEGNSRC